ncbi:unnamed protein product [Staurois parvus]|uniref:Uncharacterized protein n=1 Tax=Staurois parvus TaxID=386267 RepID=A0ABN9EAM1_9NEOB|nr:unnamed protein product [Staurois parvus]
MFATLRGPDYKSPDFWGGRPRGGRGAAPGTQKSCINLPGEPRLADH